MALEEVKFLQKQRERKSGIPAVPSNASSSSSQTTGGVSVGFGLGFAKVGGQPGTTAKADASGATDAEKEDLVLHDNFAQETAVMVEDPNMYVILALLSTCIVGALVCYTLTQKTIIRVSLCYPIKFLI